MLDVFTSVMYVDTWGRIGYARALIEVSAEKELKQVVTMVVPLEEGLGECEVGESSEGNSNDVIFEEPDSNHVESKSEGLNRAPKESEVRQVVNENHLSVCAILESHVNLSMLSKVRSKVFWSWDWTSNASLCLQGCRIILGWNLDVVSVMVSSQPNQAIHAKIVHKNTLKVLFCSFIYAGNVPSVRRHLWAELGIHKNVVRNMSWILMGDFNVALNMEDIYAGSSRMNPTMCEFKDCVANIEVMVLKSSGIHFTWNRNQRMRKWNVDVAGYSMYKVVSKMKVLKKSIRKLLHEHGNLHNRVSKLINELDKVQKALDLTLADLLLREEEVVYVHAFNDAKLDEERFLKQKAKVEWLDVGDSNSAYFHKTIKFRNQKSRIEVVMDSDN
ncbi:3-ketoacyl-CoA synthase 11-like protein, partial [Tanacetum coccineum]